MKYEISLTQGSLKKNILLFSLPLIFSNLLQVLFNMTDIAVIGRFAGPIALGAVGSTPMILFFITGIIQGLGSGINAVVAYYIGANNKKDTEETIHTSAIISLIFGFILMIIGILLANWILLLLNTKEELIQGACLYIRIYMLGMPAMAIYNYGNALLSASGDTKRPLIYLAISGIINVFLNLIFVIYFKMTVAGVATATVISQYISSILILKALFKGTKDFKLEIYKLKLTLSKCIKILKIGIPSGLQNSIYAFANLFIQIGINSFDPITIAGLSAAANADPLVYDVMNAFYAACSSFIGQNFGAKNGLRIKRTFFIVAGYSLFISIFLGSFFFIFGEEFLGLFSKNQTVINAGLYRLKVMATTYWISVFMDTAISACRGLGKTLIPSIIVILGSCVFRILWVHTIFMHYRTIESLFLLFGFSWAITAIAETIYFIIVYKTELKYLKNI